MNSEHVRRILVPVDFSDLSALGLRYAATLARCSGARVTALYADQFLPPLYFTENALENVDREIRDNKKKAEAYLAEFARTQAAGADFIDTRVEEALPADGIRHAAAELAADLIVMGTHGRSGVNRLMLGSVTERVLRETKVPVLVVRKDWNPGQIRNILCPVNDSAAARSALLTATGIARCTGATVTVLHVEEAQTGEEIRDLCAWIPESDRGICNVSELAPGGDVAGAVIALAAESRADLLVIGARHRRFFDSTVLGVNTIRMLRHAPCPVLAVFDKQ